MGAVQPHVSYDNEELDIRCYKGAIPNSEKAKLYLASVEEKFKGTSKVYVSTMIQKLLNTKYNYGSDGIREHIMMITDMAAKLLLPLTLKKLRMMVATSATR